LFFYAKACVFLLYLYASQVDQLLHPCPHSQVPHLQRIWLAIAQALHLEDRAIGALAQKLYDLEERKKGVQSKCAMFATTTSCQFALADDMSING
jgi:hypothetical protein